MSLSWPGAPVGHSVSPRYLGSVSQHYLNAFFLSMDFQNVGKYKLAYMRTVSHPKGSIKMYWCHYIYLFWPFASPKHIVLKRNLPAQLQSTSVGGGFCIICSTLTALFDNLCTFPSWNIDILCFSAVSLDLHVLFMCSLYVHHRSIQAIAFVDLTTSSWMRDHFNFSSRFWSCSKGRWECGSCPGLHFAFGPDGVVPPASPSEVSSDA